jgi:hypothetical protein
VSLYLCLITLLPHFIFTYFSLSSWTTGVLVVCFLTLSFLFIKNKLVLTNGYLKLMCYLFILLFCNLCSNIFITEQIYFSFILGILCILVYTLSMLNISIRFYSYKSQTLLNIYSFLFYLHVSIFIISIFFPQLNSSSGKNTILFFAEPSHFILSLTPIILLFSSTYKKSLFISIFFILTFLFIKDSLIGLILTPLVIVNYLYLRYSDSLKKILFLSISAILGICLLSFIVLNLNILPTYYASRLYFVENENFSILAFLYGWESILQILSNTKYLLGIGFLNMSSFNHQSDVLETLSNYNLGHIVSNSGGFILAKFITEFGYAAVISVFFLFYLLIKRLLYIRNKFNRYMYVDQMFVAYGFAFILEFLVRGSSYFSPNIFIFFSLFMIKNKHLHLN